MFETPAYVTIVAGEVPLTEDQTPFKNTIVYREREALAYLLARSPSNYAATLRVLHEACKQRQTSVLLSHVCSV